MKLPCPSSACTPSCCSAYHSLCSDPLLPLPLSPFTRSRMIPGLAQMCLCFSLCTSVCLSLNVHGCVRGFSLFCAYIQNMSCRFIPPCPADLYPTLDGGSSREHRARVTARGKAGRPMNRGQVGGRVDQSCSVLPGDWEPLQPKTSEGGLILEGHY